MLELCRCPNIYGPDCILCCFSHFTCKYSRNHSTAIVFILCVFDFIRWRCDYHDFFVQINILEGRAGYVLMGRVSVTISYSFRCLTTETVKIYQFYWEFSFIKIQYVGTERETNVIINNKCTFCIFSRRAVLSCKNVNMFVSVNCSVQRKRSNGNLVFIFSCLIDMNKFFEKHLWPLKHVNSSCFMLTMVSIIINIHYIAKSIGSPPSNEQVWLL